MKRLLDYFNEEDIVKLLCSYRAKHTHKRHKLHMMRDISLSESTNKIKISNKELEFIQLQKIFPSRRNWAVLNQNERKRNNNSLKRNKYRLFKSYTLYKNKNIPFNHSEQWFQNLINFVNTIKNSINEIDSFQFQKPKIIGILKKNNINLPEYRPIALYNIQDRVISSLTSRYLTNYFDNYFHDCSFAFRSTENSTKFNHHLAVEEILTFRNNNKSIWVSECDIQKFFDTVNHKHIIKVFNKHVEEIQRKDNIEIDKKVIKIFNKYLNSFCFNKDVLSKNGNSSWWNENELREGEFKWVKDSLEKQYGEKYLSEKIGVPQGSAISCFISNLLLHDVDSKVLNVCKDIFYVRFCDDMIIMHKNEDKCKKALEVYKNELTKNYLLYHEPVLCMDYLDKRQCKEFWKSKSKEPYFWGNPKIDNKNIPWLSFVGYQVNYMGEIRIRKQSIKKEKKKQTKQVEDIYNAIEIKKSKLNDSSRLSKKQISFSLIHRLNSMSIGRVELYNYKNPQQGLCWVNGFKLIKGNKNPHLTKQLKDLDRSKEKQIWRLNKNLIGLTKKSYKPEVIDEDEDKYFGSPFSYYNYLNDYKD